MATELTWITVPNINSPSITAAPGVTIFRKTGAYHAWFLMQTLIGANPLNSYDFGSYSGLWKLKYITSGSTYVSYSDIDDSYRTSNLWMDSDKSWNSLKCPAAYSNIIGSSDDRRNPSYAFYDPETTSDTGTRGYAVLKSPLMNGKNYYMTIDLLNHYSYDFSRIFLSIDAPNIQSNPVTSRPLFTGSFSYFVNDRSFTYVNLQFNVSSVQHKNSISLATDGSFYYYHTYNLADTMRSLFAFTSLKNYSSDDQYPVIEIRTSDGEISLSSATINDTGRGFIPASFITMAGSATGVLPYAYNWWVNKNVISRATTFFKSPRHDGTNGGSTAVSSSIGIAEHIVNVWDYTDTYSPLYGQSDINGRFGEMPIIVGSESISINNGYRALRGRIPDFKYAPNNLVQGSARPSSAPFEYIKVGGFWCPWVSSIAPTM